MFPFPFSVYSFQCVLLPTVWARTSLLKVATSRSTPATSRGEGRGGWPNPSWDWETLRDLGIEPEKDRGMWGKMPYIPPSKAFIFFKETGLYSLKMLCNFFLGGGIPSSHLELFFFTITCYLWPWRFHSSNSCRRNETNPLYMLYNYY